MPLPGPQPKTFVPGVIILAAGKSSRMGRPKLLLPWNHTTVLGHLLQQWSQLGARQIAVVWSGAPDISAELDRLGMGEDQRILNRAPDRGMFSSIQCAANWPGWQPALTHWAIALGDQPHLRKTTLRGLLDFAFTHPDKITQPMRAGRRRHPVILPRPAFRALRSTGFADLKQFLQARAAELVAWESEDPGLDFDMDEPADYERALRLAGKQDTRYKQSLAPNRHLGY